MGRHELILSVLTTAMALLSGCTKADEPAQSSSFSRTPTHNYKLIQDSRWSAAVVKYISDDSKKIFCGPERNGCVLNRSGIRVYLDKKSIMLHSNQSHSSPKLRHWFMTMDKLELTGTNSKTNVRYKDIDTGDNIISLIDDGTMKHIWINGLKSVKQQFEIYKDMGPEFQIRIHIDTNLDWRVNPHGLRASIDGSEVLIASAPMAFDADGREIQAGFVRIDDTLVISVSNAEIYPIYIDPAWKVAGEQSQASWFGWSVEPAGDVNKDGFDDVVVAAPFFHTGNQSAGKIYLYYGSSQGLSLTPAWTSSGDDSNRALFGWSVASGDFNGDGYSDIAVGAPSRADTGDTIGKAFVFLGSFNGPLPAKWESSGDGEQGSFFGTSICSAGDTNGDGFDDLLVGAPAASISGGASSMPGKAFLFSGSPSGPSLSPAWTSSADAQPGSGFGWSVTGAGDVNADGYDDIAIGAHLYDMTASDTGRVFLFTGAQSFPGQSFTWAESGDVQQGAQFGWSISGGTIDADAYSDLLVGAPGYDSPAASAGRVYAYRGGDGNTGLDSSYWWVSCADGHAGAQFGWSVVVAGDINNDGYGEVLAGAPGDSSAGNNAGKIWLFNGSPAGPLEPASFSSSGDEQAGAGFGGCVAAAGDINNDHAADFLVGAYLMDSGGIDTGAAYLYFGSPGGGPGVCEPIGTLCDDHDNCTHTDKCDAKGQCHGTPFSCDDQNPCTDDICRPEGTCSFLHNTQPCDDANACTSPDVCSASECRGTPTDCTWLNDQCNTGVCDSGTGQCHPQAVADGTPCDDADSCTTDETCSGGLCIPGVYSCDKDSGCGCTTGDSNSGSVLSLLVILSALAALFSRAKT